MLAESGEDAIVSCNTCDYAANVEKAEVKAARPAGRDIAEESPKLEKFRRLERKASPKWPSISSCRAKILSRRWSTGPIAASSSPCLVRGDHEVNELKLKTVLGCREIALADEASVAAAIGAAPDFSGRSA